MWNRRHVPLRSCLVPLLVVALLLPLLLVWVPAQADQAVGSSYSPPIRWTHLAASLLVAGAAAAIAVIVGALLGALFSLTDFPWTPVWATLCLLPFVAPPAVWALGQVYCYGQGGLVELACGDRWRPAVAWLDQGHYAATAVVLAQIHAPLAMLIVGRALGHVHEAGFESARFYLDTPRFAWWLCKAVRPELGAAFLLAFALALGNFAAPHVLQCRLYPIEVYARMANYLDPSGAVWAATPLLLATLLAATLLALVERRGTRALPEPQRPTRLRLGRRRWLYGGLLLAYLGGTVGMPIAAMLYQCGSAAHFLDAVRDAAPETENTLRIAAGSSMLACLAGVSVAFWVVRANRPLREVLATIPIAVPGLLVGLAYVRFYNRTAPIDLSVLGSSSALVVLGLGFRAWPFATRIVATGQRRMPAAWDEAARVSQLRAWRKHRWITAPLMFDQLAAGAVIAFVLAVGEVEISQMLCAPGQGTLALRLFTFLHFGPTHVAASLAVLQLTVATAPVLLYYLLWNRCLPIV